MKKTVYISGSITNPATGQPRDGWQKDFLEAEAKLRGMGFHVINPIDKVIIKKGKKPAAWSEEDKRMINKLLAVVKLYYAKDADDLDKQSCSTWLKSLRPQNWTKEDKERYISCFQRLGTCNPEQPETINSKWFKEHVYSKPQWKPSDEQMKALNTCIMQGEISYVGQGTELQSLYNDLKKLTE